MRYLKILFLICAINLYPISGRAVIMSNGSYKIQSDIFDSTATSNDYSMGNDIYNASSSGQSGVVGYESSVGTTNYSGFLPDAGNLIAKNITSGYRYHTIQEAINNAQKGDVIYVSAGILSESFNLAHKTNIQIKALSWVSNSINTNSIITGVSNEYVIDLSYSFKCSIVGFVIKGGYKGIHISSHSPNSNYIAHNIFYSNIIGVGITNGNWNTITSNTFYSCSNSIYIIGDSKTNTVFSNFIYNSTNGIVLDSGDDNLFEQNKIKNCNNAIYIIGDAQRNDIINNIAYSNECGIQVFDWNANYNFIGFNNIFLNTSSGLWLRDGDFNTVYSNSFYNNSSAGVYLYNTAVNNRIVGNSVYSNNLYGIYLYGESCDDNSIESNIIYGTNQNYGIYIYYADNIKISRNLIRDNNSSGIYLFLSVTNINIVNNTIFDTVSGDAIYGGTTSSAYVYNNILLSNAGYGIKNTSTGIFYSAYNNFYGNISGPTNGGIVMGKGNAFTDPMIETVTSFTIMNARSPAVDSGTNIAGVSDVYFGLGPDIGWKESYFIYNGPYYVSPFGDDSDIGNLANPFKTVHHAADVMSGGVTVATTYIFPGTYSEQIDIYSNANTGYMVFTALSNTKPEIKDAAGFNYGFYITNASSILLLNLNISKFTQGIYFAGTATNNYIAHSIICSNEKYGIYIYNNDSDKNYFMTNMIFNNQEGGVYLEEADNIVFKSNKVYNNNWYGFNISGTVIGCEVADNMIVSQGLYGMYLGVGAYSNVIENNIINGNGSSGMRFFNGEKNILRNNYIMHHTDSGIYATGTFISNRIINNEIYSNDNNGIYLGDEGADNNCILSNTIYGLNQDNGINLDYADNNIINNNVLLKNQTSGVYLINSAENNVIANNNIYSNLSYGVFINSDLADNNFIMSNNIWGLNQSRGINIGYGDNTVVKSNRIHNNSQYGICLFSGAQNTYIVKNTIYSNSLYGIIIDIDTTDNNSIMSNIIYGYNQDYGIYINNGDKNSINNNNRIIKNQIGGIYLLGSAESNTIANNFICSNKRLGIRIITSNNIVNENTFCSNHTYAVFITNGDNTKMSNNNITLSSNGIWIKDSVYITLYSNNIHNILANGIYLENCNTNEVLRNTVSTNNLNDMNGIYVSGVHNNISYNEVTEIATGINAAGIYIYSDNNNLTNNMVYSLACSAIHINGDYCNIIDNNIYDYLNRGLSIYGSFNNITFNTVHNFNNTPGIVLWDNTKTGNKILNNVSYSNEYGIRMSYNINDTFISNNIIFANNYGIEGDPAGADIINNQIYSNIIDGIHLSDITNVNILYNEVFNNATNGIWLTNVKSVNIKLNSITNNRTGLLIKDNVTNMIFTKNNIYNNITLNVSNSVTTVYLLTNNWWGSTIKSSIMGKISGVEFSNIEPYRLFGEFDITEGADTERLPEITFATAISTTTSVTLIWSKPAVTSDFARYFIYRSTNVGYTNLSISDVIWQTNDVNKTNFIDIPPTAGTYYYYITSLDGSGIYTNESWYSVEASATVGTISVLATNTNLFYTNILLNFTTASQVTYISNNGTLPCKVVGQIDDFTNNYYGTPLVWDVTNSVSLSKDEIRVEVKTSPNGALSTWTTIVNKEQVFTVDDNLPVGDVVYLYIRITTPPITSSTKEYRSKIRLNAQSP